MTITEQQGAAGPQGPGWWQANDGRWYPPAAPPTPPRQRAATPWWPPKGPYLMAIVAIIAGLALTVAGLAFGGSDEDPDELRRDLSGEEAALATAQDDLDAAEATEAAFDAFLAAYAVSADELANTVDEACDCGEELTELRQQQLSVFQAFFQNPNDASLDLIDDLSREQNAELQRLRTLLDEIRLLDADLPEQPAG